MACGGCKKARAEFERKMREDPNFAKVQMELRKQREEMSRKNNEILKQKGRVNPPANIPPVSSNVSIPPIPTNSDPNIPFKTRKQLRIEARQARIARRQARIKRRQERAKRRAEMNRRKFSIGLR